MSEAIDITRLSCDEKLRVMEAIWEDLTRDAEQVESPGWHREVLDETERRLKAGQEGVKDWNEAKSELRKRFGLTARSGIGSEPAVP